ncbi:LysR family transcriptional regulator [Pontixanthobacter aquaemixtae]|nr:LysR family transcriptional regulator [Pontixanthobacter aquaemixtae]
MRLRHIEIFYHVYLEGSISGAARVLHVSQPSVSKTLRHAEDQLGFLLFDRIKGRLRPTPAADELFVEVHDIYSKMASFDRTARNIRGRTGGHIRLGVLPSLGFSVVPKFIAQMRALNRHLSFDVSTLHTDDFGPALVERRHDICLGFGYEEDSRIAQHHINNVDMVVLSRPGDLPGSGEQISINALHEREFIGLTDSGPAAALANSMMIENGIEPTGIVTAHTHYVAAALVRLGVGLAIVDMFTAQSSAADGLKISQIEEGMQLPFEAMYLRNNQQLALIEECIHALDALFGNGPINPAES